MRKLGSALALWLAATLLACLVAYAIGAIDERARPSREAQAWALDALEHADASAPPESAQRYRAEGAILIHAWSRGHVVAKHAGPSELVAAIEGAIAAFAEVDRQEARFTVTAILGDAPLLLGVPYLENLGLVPLREGLVAELGDRRAYLTPDELVESGAYERGISTPIPELTVGVDIEDLADLLSRELGAELEEVRAQGSIRRFRAGTFSRNDYPREPRIDVATLRRGAREGAEFLLRHQRGNGRFTYVYDARTNRARAEDYNFPRHAGATYFLAQAHRLLGMPEAREGALRALRWLEPRVANCGSEGELCVENRGRVEVGSAALTAIAAAEILATGDDPLARRLLTGLTAFLRAQQREDGELMHEYDLRRQRPIDVQRLYYSGEATLALLRAHEVGGDERNLEAARRLMTHLTGEGWSFLGSRYFYGEEHWTCISAGEASDRIESPEALDFCRRWAAYNGQLQFRANHTPWNISGAFGAGPIVLPRITPVASRTEAHISTYEMSRRAGIDDPELRAEIERGLAMLLRWQFSPGPAHLFANVDGARGGLPGSPAELTVRNDFVQHACSAMARWADILDRE